MYKQKMTTNSWFEIHAGGRDVTTINQFAKDDASNTDWKTCSRNKKLVLELI